MALATIIRVSNYFCREEIISRNYPVKKKELDQTLIPTQYLPEDLLNPSEKKLEVKTRILISCI